MKDSQHAGIVEALQAKYIKESNERFSTSETPIFGGF